MITAIDQRSVDQITAGKVVVTLAMSIKELVENSIDSGASSIHVHLDNFGLDGFSVTDNGSGIDEQDYDLVARKYTTSKLTKFEDLDSISTLGFRGEALGSLCAMARVEITTNTRTSGAGHTLTFDETGTVIDKKVAPAPKGTTVKITDLFRTAPVRRKDFERHHKSEYTKMVQLVQAYALIAPIKLIVDNTVKARKTVAIQSQGESMDKRIAAVYGISALKGLLPIDLKNQLFDVAGYISEPVFGKGRPGTDRQLLFVNSRPAILPKLQKAINTVYQLSNSTESPFFVLNFTIDPHNYDVNLSADKRTLLLHDEGRILETLRESLTDFFENSGHNIPLSSQPMPKRLKAQPQSSLLQQFAGSGPVHRRELDKEEVVVQLQKPSSRRQLPTSDTMITDFVSAASLPCDPPSERPRPSKLRKDKSDELFMPDTSDMLDMIFNEAGSIPDLSDVAAKSQTRSASAQKTAEPSKASPAVPEPSDPEPPVEPASPESGAQVVAVQEAQTPANPPTSRPPTSELPTSRPPTSELPTSELPTSEPPTSEPPTSEPPSSAPAREPTIACPAPEQSIDVAESLNVENKQPDVALSQLGKTLNTHISLPTSIQDVRDALQALRPHEQNNILNHSIEESDVEERLSLTIRKDDFASMRVIGQFNRGFILVVKRADSDKHGDLFVIDQHASDEIFNFERLGNELQMNRQPLVQPRPLELSPVEELTVINHMDVFENNGFSISIVPDAQPGKQCQLTALPYSKNWVFGEKDVHELIYKIQENPADRKIKCSSLRAMLAMRACRSSIMIGKPLSHKTMVRVVANLGTLNKPWNCPHGRPTLRHITSLR